MIYLTTVTLTMGWVA